MKKAIGQTVRDLKRGVNKKVLKVPRIEQKVLDATSNEPWGPHGSLLADIAQASRNLREYHMIMSVLWKRINDTGKNWRHVYKALIVLEYLIAHGFEQVIEDIREHAYQISTLSDFQYVDSGGKDQGNNVRRKSQSLVALVNNKERVQEIRQKALANHEKSSWQVGHNGTGFEYYENDRNNDRGGAYEYGRDGRGGYGEDGQHQTKDDEYYRRGNRSHQRDAEPSSYDDNDDDYYSSRSGGGEADSQFQDESHPAPPSYEEILKESEEAMHGDGSTEADESGVAPDHLLSPVTAVSTALSGSAVAAPDSVADNPAGLSEKQEFNGFDEFDPRGSVFTADTAPPVAGIFEMDFFGSLSSDPTDHVDDQAPTKFSNGGSSDVQIPSSSVLVAASDTTAMSQPSDNPFGSGNPFGDPSSFKAMPVDLSTMPFDSFASLDGILPQETLPAPPQQTISTPFSSFHSLYSEGELDALPSDPKATAPTNFEFGDALGNLTYTSPVESAVQQELPGSNSQVPTGINSFLLPQSAQPANNELGQVNLVAEASPAANFPALQYMPQQQQPAAFQSGLSQPGRQNPFPFGVPPAALPLDPMQQPMSVSVDASKSLVPLVTQPGFAGQQPIASPLGAQLGPWQPVAPPNTSLMFDARQITALGVQPSSVPAAPPTAPMPSATIMTQIVPSTAPPPMLPMPSSSIMTEMAPAAAAPLSLGTDDVANSAKTQPAKKFEPKSTVWADTLSRGLVNLNISGPKTNPHADIGVDFDSMNRKEKREEKRTTAAPVVSTITMGKAMEAGSGMGRAGAGAISAAVPPNAMGIGRAVSGYGSAPFNPPLGPGYGVGQGMPVMHPGEQPIPSGVNYIPARNPYGPPAAQQPFGGYR